MVKLIEMIGDIIEMNSEIEYVWKFKNMRFGSHFVIFPENIWFN